MSIPGHHLWFSRMRAFVQRHALVVVVVAVGVALLMVRRRG